jgi:hypothetical protein
MKIYWNTLISRTGYCEEGLVQPMLDMSIGEAAVPSGRRPQFTQERSATKKVPLQAGGCENFVPIGAGLSPK